MNEDTKKNVILEVCKTFRFEAAHQLPYHDGKCANLHGHSYRVEICFAGVVREDDPADPQSGMVVDYYNISKEWEPLCERFLDHHNINDIIPNSTAENLCLWLASYFEHAFSGQMVELTKVVVYETPTSSVTWTKY